MYSVKMAFALVQIGTKLWVNPLQIQGIAFNEGSSLCPTIVFLSVKNESVCSDWPFEKVQQALSTSAVAKSTEGR